MPLGLVVANHGTEQAQFPDYLSLESVWALKNAESGHHFSDTSVTYSGIQPSKKFVLEIGNAG